MSVLLNPYISFREGTLTAMEFYRSVFGGELTVLTYEAGGMPYQPGEGDKVMHSQLDTPNGLVLMAADTPASMDHTPGGAITISLSGTDESVLTGYWEALSDGGTVGMPLAKAPWGDSFGACVDRFGVSWMFNIGT